VRAERLAVTEKAKARNRTQKRSGSRWTRSDEVLFQDRAITTWRLKLGEAAWRQAA
jgi:hypothetical protein